MDEKVLYQRLYINLNNIRQSLNTYNSSLDNLYTALQKDFIVDKKRYLNEELDIEREKMQNIKDSLRQTIIDVTNRM
jgi:hypothetical protein